jgi:hypothetical protein
MKFLNTPIDEKLLKQLKIMVIKKDLTIEKAVTEAIIDLLKKYGGDKEDV